MFNIIKILPRIACNIALLKNATLLLILLIVSCIITADAQNNKLEMLTVPTEINVEIDWMQNSSHSHKPSVDEMEVVVQMFACQGIKLNYDISDNIGHINVLKVNPSNHNEFFDYIGADSFDSLKNIFQDHTGGGWHYCIFGHQFQDESLHTVTSSGLGETPGDDFIVSLGGFDSSIGSSYDRASTFAHELGHNLNLQHYGSMSSTVGNYAVNLPSIMSYRFQLRGVKNVLECLGLVRHGAHPFKNIDYSHGRLADLNESSLSENLGMRLVSVDWNCDTTIGTTAASADLSNERSPSYGWCSSTGALQTITDYNEWSHIRDVTRLAKSQYHSKTVSCISAQEVAKFDLYDGSCPQPTLELESCIDKGMYYAKYDPDETVYTGNWDYPYVTLHDAQSYTSSGDYIYLYPGTYEEPSLILDKKRVYSGPGTIIIK